MKFLIKLYDINDNYIGTVGSDRLKNKIVFTKQINGGLGNLDLTFDVSFHFSMPQIHRCELYYFDNTIKKGKLIYNGIKFQEEFIKKDIEEYTISFVGLGSILYNLIYYDFSQDGSSKIYETTKNKDPFLILDDIIRNTRNQDCIITSTNGTFEVGDEITDGGAHGFIKMYDSNSGKAVVEIKGDYNFISGRNINAIGGSLAEGKIYIEYYNKYYNYFKLIEANEYGKNLNKNYNYKKNGEILKDIGNFSRGYYYYIDEFGNVIYKKIENSPTYNLIFDKNIISIDEIVRYNNIENSGILKYFDGEVSYKDVGSINKYGLKEKFIEDVDILDKDTAIGFLMNYIDDNSQPKKEIILKIRLETNILNKIKLWKDYTNDWNTYNITWKNTEGDKTSIIDLQPGDKVNILNIKKKMRDLVIHKIIFNGNHLLVYLNDYKNLYSLI